MPLLWSGSQSGHLSDSRHGHLEGSWNRSRAHSQDIDIVLQLLELFLVLDPEALFLIDDY